MALQTREVPRDEARLLGTARDDEVGRRDAAAQQEQEQEHDNQEAVPRPPGLVVLLYRIGIRAGVDVFDVCGFRIGQRSSLAPRGQMDTFA